MMRSKVGPSRKATSRLLAEEGLFNWFEHATEDGATLDEDSLDRWRGERRLDSTEQRAGSWDYRSLSGREQSAVSAIDHGDIPSLPTEDDPGQYAWQSLDHGERMQRNQRVDSF